MNAKEQIVVEAKKIVEKRKKPLIILGLYEVDRNNSLRIYDYLCQKSCYIELDVILQTGGGDIDAAFSILKILKKSCKKLNIIVPLFAKSAGTLICLGADNLLLTDLSELGPLDTQIREKDSQDYKSALNALNALRQIRLHSLETLDITTKLIIDRSDMNISEAIKLAIKFTGETSGRLYSKLDPNKIGEYARALDVGMKYGVTIMARYMGWDHAKAGKMIRRLVYSYPSHGYVIDIDELKELGLPTDKIEDKEELFPHIMNLRDRLLELYSNKETLIQLIEYSDNSDTKNKEDSTTDISNKEERNLSLQL